MKEKNFETLYLTEAPQNQTDGMTRFYHTEGIRNGFKGVYTDEGYYLSNEISKGRGWHKWFTEQRAEGATNYKQEISCYGVDGATEIECRLRAYDKDGNKLGATKLNGTYIGASETNHKEREDEWKAGLQNDFNEVIDSVQTFLVWTGWAQAKGL